MTALLIRNWDKWQSYRKDRGAPPWIKVHRRLFLNPEWNSLTDAQKGQVISLWVLASDRNGAIPDDARMLRKLCGLDDTPDIDLFISLGFIEKRTTTKRRKHDNQEQPERLSQTHGHVRLDTEAEAETEAETDARAGRADGLDVVAWERWLTYRAGIRKPLKPVSQQAAQKQLAAFGKDQAAVVEQSIANGWQGLFALKQPAKVNGYPQTDDDWMAKGRELGIHAKPGETMRAYTGRLKTALEGQHGNA